ncbi:MAG: hypothetical protein NVS2B16_16290 [Chloroflexota bacterium]
MDRARFISSFCAVSLALLLLNVVAHFGYTGVKAMSILVAIGVVSILVLGFTNAAAGAATFFVYHVLAQVLGDVVTGSVILATAAAAAALATEGKTVWRK